MNNILLVIEDDEEIRTMVVSYFCGRGYNVLEAEDGKSGLAILKSESVDIVFLDIMLPDMDGFSVCRNIRMTSDVPIIMLTARAQDEDKVQGFEQGADEYVTKPFSLKVLAARAQGLLKRVNNRISDSSYIHSFDGLVVNEKTGEVAVDGRNILLTQKEWELFEYLLLNENIIMGKQQILDKVWGYGYDGDPRTVDTHIRRLRDKLGAGERYIRTYRGRGYCFCTKTD